MPAHRKASIRELAADARELDAGVLQGSLVGRCGGVGGHEAVPSVCSDSTGTASDWGGSQSRTSIWPVTAAVMRD